MDWPETLKTAAVSITIIGAIVTVGGFWIPYTEPVWRIAALGTIAVLTIRIYQRSGARYSDLAMIALLVLVILVGSPAFGLG